MPPRPALPQSRAGCVVSGHFGEWMQGRLGPQGPVVLITLPCPAQCLTVTTGPSSLHGRQAARALLPAPRRARLGRALNLRLPPALSVPVSPLRGGGAGSSTAALIALARLAGFTGPATTLARACRHTEGASDPLMFPDPDRLLFAPRLGRVIEHLPALPQCTILGGFDGPGQRTDPRDLRFADIADLLPVWRRAARAGDLHLLARLATHSAARSLALRGPAQDPTAELAARLGALGWVIAHTGSARGLIFAPGRVPDGARAALADAGFSGIVQFDTGTRTEGRT